MCIRLFRTLETLLDDISLGESKEGREETDGNEPKIPSRFETSVDSSSLARAMGKSTYVKEKRFSMDFGFLLFSSSFQISRETLYTPEVKKKKRNRIGKRFFGRASERKRKKRNRKRKRNKRRNKRGRGRSEVKYTSHGCKSAARCAFNFGFPRAENIRATFRAGIASRLTGIPTGTGVSYLIIVA